MRSRRTLLLGIVAPLAGALVASVPLVDFLEDPAKRDPWRLSLAALALLAASTVILITVYSVRRDSLAEKHAADIGLRCRVARVGSTSLNHLGLAPVLPLSQAKQYLPRTTADLRLRTEIKRAFAGGDQWMVLAAGPALVGKSRTLFEALRRHDADTEQILLVAPKNLAALRRLLDPVSGYPRICGGAALWLDDLTPFLNDGLTVDELQTWRDSAPGRIVAATYGNAGDLSTLTYFQCFQRHIRQVDLASTSSAELDRLHPPLTAADRSDAANHGWAAFLVAGPRLARIMTSKRHAGDDRDSYEGSAVVDVLADWSRCGCATPPTEVQLRKLWRLYLHPKLAPTDDLFQHGIAWATRPVAATIALVEYSNGYVANRFAVRQRADTDQSGPRDEIFAVALETASIKESLAIALVADGLGRWEHALAGYERTVAAPTGSIPESQHSMALFGLIRAQVNLVQYDAALANCDALLVALTEQESDFARALIASIHAIRGSIYFERKMLRSSLDAWQAAISSNTSVRGQLVQAFYNKGALIDLMREDYGADWAPAAQSAWQAAIDEFDRPTTSTLPPLVQVERLNTAAAMARLAGSYWSADHFVDQRPQPADFGQARAMYVRLLRQFGADSDPTTALCVEDGMRDLGYALVHQLSTWGQAPDTTDETNHVLQSCERRLFATSLLSGEAKGQVDHDRVLAALFNKAAMMAMQGIGSAAVREVLHELISRSEANAGPQSIDAQRLVARARLIDGFSLATHGHHAKARGRFAKVIEECSGSDDRALKGYLAKATECIAQLRGTETDIE